MRLASRPQASLADVNYKMVVLSSENIVTLSCYVQLSGERVLTMEWIDGCKLTDRESLVAMRVHPRDVALELLHAFAQMTFVDGFGERRSSLYRRACTGDTNFDYMHFFRLYQNGAPLGMHQPAANVIGACILNSACCQQYRPHQMFVLQRTARSMAFCCRIWPKGYS